MITKPERTMIHKRWLALWEARACSNDCAVSTGNLAKALARL